MAKNNRKNEMIRIHKEAGARKDAVRISLMKDIPDFLKSSITIVDGKIKLVCVEGNETCDLGSVIGYEKSDSTASGYNCWCIGNADTNLIEKDGVFYKKATILKAQLIGDVIPDFVSGAKITRNEDDSYTLTTTWGNVTGKPGEAYWVLYGENKDGSPDANILTKTEKSYKEYIVCDDNGVDIGLLFEIDPVE